MSWTLDSLPSGCEPTYSVWRKEGSGSYEEIVGSQTGTTYQDTGLSPETTYAYRVRATNDGGTVLDEDEATTPDGVSPPTGLSATEISSSEIRVTWDAVSGADGYEVRKQQEGGSWGAAVNVGRTTSYRASGLRSNTLYTFEVRTIDGSETSGWTSPPASATTKVPRPTGLRATALSPSAIRVRWNAVPGADSYEIRRQRENGSWGAAVDVGSATSYRASGLQSNTRYEFEARAIVGSRTSDWSAPDDATTLPPRPTPPPVSRPTGLTATAVSWSEVEVTWNAVSRADSYDIQMMESGGSWGETVDAGAGTSYSSTGLAANTQYRFRVRTVDGSRTSGWTVSVSATTEVRPPENLAATAESASSVRVTWDLVPGADRYDLRRREDGGSWGSPVNAGAGTEYLVDGLAAETRHEFQLRTVAGSRASDWTASVSATTPAEVNPPTRLSAVAVSWREIAVAWKFVAGADRYELQRSRRGGPWGATVDAGAETGFDDTGLIGNMVYSYRVRSVAGTGKSEWTAPASTSTEVQPPENPAAMAESANSVRVTWDAVSRTDRYEIRHSEDGGSWEAPLNAGSGTEYLVGGLTAETRHAFQLRSVAGFRTSDWTASVSATTGSLPVPEPPANFRSTGATATTVALGWDAVSGADRYRIRRAAGGESDWESFTVETTSAVDEDLDPATTYRYQIQTVLAEGRPSEWSAPALSVTTAALGTPANLTVAGQTATAVSLAWDAVAEAEGYELRRDGGAVIAAGDGTSYTDGSLTPDTAYAYEIRASRGSARSGWSPAVPARTAGVMPPENLRAEATSAFSVEVRWNPVFGADGYEVHRLRSPRPVRVPGTRHEETGLAPEAPHVFRVRTIVGRARSHWAPAVLAVTMPFRAPANLAASASGTTVELRWDPVPGTETYRIRRRQGSGSWERFEETGTSASDEGLAEGTEYEYQVRARRGPYKSPWSAAVRVTTGRR